MREISKDNLLRSWKDISTYLGVDVRTCHRWEARHGMPVHRAEGAEKRSNVFAYKDELDDWFRRTFRNHGPQGEGDVLAAPSRHWWKWALAAVALVAVAAVVFLSDVSRPKGQPADFRIEGPLLVVFDREGQELWRFDSGMEDLEQEEFYRQHYQVRDHNAGNILPAIVIKDIDGDGDVEVLFAPKRVTDQTGEGWLHCFDREGREKWPPFKAGRELRCGGTVFSPDYRVAGFHPHDFDGDGKMEIVLEAHHAPDWPCQLAVLDSGGKMLGEYWNAGYLRDTAYQDLDGDGREELIVVGVNKEYRSGCLVVLDPFELGGGSPQTGRYACEDLEPGTELYYLVVPPNDVAEALGRFAADLLMLDVTENLRIRATSTLGLYYEFDFELRPLQVGVGDGYKIRHRELFTEGKISSDLEDEAYLRAILGDVRFWSGTEWVPEATKVRR